MTRNVDVVVIGGGGAGLGAALQLGRMRRRVAVIDSGRPRNQPAAHMHGYLGHDGIAPSHFLATARAEVTGYGVELIDDAVLGIEGDAERGFTVTVGQGEQRRARRVVVATGITDVLPGIPGVAEHWGRSVIHCPYCHGWEVRDQRLVVIDTTGLGAHQALLFQQLSEAVTLVVHAGPGPDQAQRDLLDLAGVPVVAQEVVRLDGPTDSAPTGPVAGGGAGAGGSGGVEVVLSDGSRLVADAVVVGAPFRANLGPLAQLGLVLVDHPSGLGQVVETGPVGATSVAGVYAVGNIVDPSHQVLQAAADGARVGAFLNFDLVHDDLAGRARARSDVGQGG